MTKATALRIFKETYKTAGVVLDQRQLLAAWSVYTDSLYKDGRITHTQNYKWVNPFMVPIL
jgi:hypothetical protein